MKSIPIHLNSNDDILLSLSKLGKAYNSKFFVLGVVGNLSKATFLCPGLSKPTLLEGNLEVITLNGTISPNSVHLHLSISDTTCNVWGGHLEKGTIVLKGVDLLLGIVNEPYSVVSLNDNEQKSIIQNQRIKIYVLNGCPWSNRAIRILNSYNFEYSKITIESDDEYKKINLLSKSSSFPQIFIDCNYIGGYEELEKLHKNGDLHKL